MSTSVFDLFAKIKLDSSEYDKGLDDAERKGEGAGAKIGKGLVAAGKAAGVAIGAAATGIAALTKKSASAFAEQQQLVGGVHKLYGDAADQLLEYANQAYATAGMSANKYMETATSFSAALINSLGGDAKAAAEQTDVAMRAISDNFNTFGGDMESVTNAFMGFAKQNYTMLDNLKLGYGGTKGEMERLIADANALGAANGEAADLSIESFSDVVTAIQRIQEAQGIAGTTGAEAASTVSGSVGAVSAAWENLVAGFADGNADLGQLIDNVVVSAETAFTNMMPVITQALAGIGNFISEMVPVITEKLPELVEQILPPLISAATSLVTGLVSALPELIVVVAEQIPTIMQSVWDAIVATLPTLVESITANAPMLIDAGMQLVTMLSDGVTQGFTFLTEQLPTMIDEWLTGFDTKAPSLIDKGADMLTKLADGLTQGIPKALGAIAKVITDILSHLTNNMPQLMSKGTDLISNLATGLFNALPKVITSIGKIVSGILDFVIDNFPTIMQNGMKLIINLAQGLIKALPNIIQSITQIITGLINKLIAAIPMIIQTGFKLIAQLALGLLKALPDIIKAALALAKGVIDTFTQTDWLSIGVNIIKGIISGIGSMAKMFLDAIVNLAKSAFDGIKNFFGIHSPSKKMRDEIGKNIVKGLIQGVDDEKKNAKKSAEELGELYVSAAKKKVESLKENNKLSLMEEWAYWEEIREHTKKGTQAYDEATKMIGKAKNNITKEVNSLNKEYAEGVQKIIDNLDKEVTRLEETYTKAVADRQKALMGQMSMFETFTPKEGKGKDDLMQSMISQVEGMAEYTSTMTSLQARLGDTAPEFYEELKGMNVDQLETLKAINEMSDQELETYVGLYNAKQMMAEDRAKRDNEELKEQTDAQIEELKTNAQTQLDELEKKYKKGIKALGVEGHKQFKKAGKYSVEGMGIGMNTEFDKLEAQMKARAAALVASIQAALKIHSPSKVFADEVGKFIPLGIAEGVENAMPEAERGILASVDDMKNAVAGDMSFDGITGNFKTDSSPVVMLLAGIYEAVIGMPDEMGENFGDALRNTTFSINEREFARLVKAV